MTTLIQQKSGHDCALAAMAMMIGAQSWDEVWTEADLQKVIAENGIGDLSPWLKRLGMEPRVHYCTAYVHGLADHDTIRTLLWMRRALLSVHSLNLPDGNHMIYWDGGRIWDPSTARTYEHLRSAIISRIYVFDDSIPRLTSEAPVATLMEIRP